MSHDFQTLPIDADSAALLREQGLRLGLVDTADADMFGNWLHAVALGFHDPRPAPELLDEQLRSLTDRRTTAVWDDSAVEPESPLATVSSWPTELTVPGLTVPELAVPRGTVANGGTGDRGATVPAWAISAVTVSGAYRRRGLGRALLTAELRTAHRLGIPIAALTVSEATIYHRFGFAPAAMSADVTIDTRRAGWAGPAASGRVQIVSLDRMRVDGAALIERVRATSPGEITMPNRQWDRYLGIGTDRAANVRFARYDDGAGVPQGFAIYQVSDSGPNHSAQVVDVHYFVAATDDAYAGLWRFLIELDLVGTVKAPLRPVDELLPWQLTDFRAAQKSNERDHLWLRILDVKAALEARRYSAPGRIVLDVDDPLGFAAGRVLLEIDENGTGVVSPAPNEIPDAAAALSLSVNELAALYLGGVSAVSLARAGRIRELRPGSARMVDAAFRSGSTPWLSFWF